MKNIIVWKIGSRQFVPCIGSLSRGLRKLYELTNKTFWEERLMLTFV